MMTSLVDGQPQKIPTRWYQWWPILLAGVAFLWVAIAHWTGNEFLHRKEYLERIALGLAIAACLIALVRLILTKHPYRMLLFAVTVCVMCREFHWDWTDKAVYAGIGAIAIWGFFWLDRLTPYTDSQPRVRVWLISTAIMYVLSQLIARRAMQHLSPDGSEFHQFAEQIYDSLEEVLENTAHIMLIITAIVGRHDQQTSANYVSTKDSSPAEDQAD